MFELFALLAVSIVAGQAAAADGSYGAAGFVIAGVTVGATALGLLTKQLYTKAHVDDLRADKALMQEQLQKLSDRDTTLTIPTLHDAIGVLQNVQVSLSKMDASIERMRESVERDRGRDGY